MSIVNPAAKWLGPLTLILAGCGGSSPDVRGQNAAVPTVELEALDADGTEQQELYGEGPQPAATGTGGGRPGAPPPANRPQPGPAADRATARALAMEGMQKLDAGDAAGALAAFTRADAIMNGVPTLRMYMGRAQLQLGQRAQARQTFESVVQMPRAPNEPQVFQKARQEAAAALQQLGP